jgi:hypothetical protein
MMTKAPASPADEDGAGLVGVIGTVEELIQVIEAENRLLERGMPASLSRSTERKSSLAAILAAALADEAGRAAVRALPEPARTRLAQRIGMAQHLADENSARLEAAMRASRRRIAAVMAAVRDHARREAAGYAANGRRPAAMQTGVMTSGRVV